MSIFGAPEALGGLVLKWAVAKYIEAAGSVQQAQLQRAQTVKSMAVGIEGVVAGGTSVAQLQNAAQAELSAKGLSTSNAIMIQGLIGLVGQALPPSGGLLDAALAAEVGVFLTDVVSVATQFGA